MFKPSIAFLGNEPWTRFLDSCWGEERGYLDPISHEPTINTVTILKLSLYHLYCALLGLPGPHVVRCEVLLGQVIRSVTEHGALRFLNETTEHPAQCCFAAEALGAAAFYGEKIGLSPDSRKNAAAALHRIVTRNSRIRPPAGLAGRTQQLRFEALAYYWNWRVTGAPDDRKNFLELFDCGVARYTHAYAYEGGHTPPAIHPDWTWNYAAHSGTTTEFATNTHTPVYYIGEQTGFLFAYLHGLKSGILDRRPAWDHFAHGYIGGLFRNYSRAGHISMDVDGYGIHRAWNGSLLTECSPQDGAAAAAVLGLPAEWSSWLSWYAERHIDFVQRSPDFPKSGIPSQFPYGHRITIEKQFDFLSSIKLYTQLARSCFEYADIAAPPAVAPPAFADYAWWHQWVRVSTPAYETSVVGVTSLLNIPIVKSFGDPHLGTLNGGCPISTLMIGDRLMYATGNRSEGLWHIAVEDVNGKTHRSCATSFQDGSFFAATDQAGAIRTAEQIADYAIISPQPLAGQPCQTIWRRTVEPEQITFWSRHFFRPEDFEFSWGFRGRAGFYVASAVFHLPVPLAMNPEVRWGAEWIAMKPGDERQGCPTGLRWSDGPATMEMDLEVVNEAPADIVTGCVAISTSPGFPGGENSFCPFPLAALRIETRAHEMALRVVARPRTT